jgi:NADH dehydrogenase FAD-containing subunit
LFLNKRIAQYMARSLHRLGVTVQDQTVVTEIRKNAAVTADGALIPFDVCLWAGGFTAAPLARESGLAVNELGQILVDPFMRSLSHLEIYAAGDAAQPVEEPGVPMRMSAFTAVVTGLHAADSLGAHLHGKTARPLSFAYLGQGIALGRHNAIGFNNFPDDKPNAPYFTGRLGYMVRESFVQLLAALPRLEWRMPGFFIVFGRGRYAASKRKAEQRLAIGSQSAQHGSI